MAQIIQIGNKIPRTNAPVAYVVGNDLGLDRANDAAIQAVIVITKTATPSTTSRRTFRYFVGAAT